jgi:hypothetical protein
MIKHNGNEQIGIIDSIGSIPWEWWAEVDAACEAFFKRKGMKPLPDFRQQIHNDCMTKAAAKKGKE